MKPAVWMLGGVVLYLIVGLVLSERSKRFSAKYLCLIAVMTTLAVIGRVLFAFVPGFKPVTAIIMLSGMYFGAPAGFLTGALAPLISNLYFMQGPWTPFQMFAWSLVGVMSAFLAKSLKKSPVFLLAMGAVFGILYSLIMDGWMVLWYQPRAEFGVYVAAVIAALPTTLTYMVSNVVFLCVLAPILGKRLERAAGKCQVVSKK